MQDDGKKLGTLVQRCELSKSANMDALEARIVQVQDLPPKSDLRFFAVRGEEREQLTSVAACALLREHAPQKSFVSMSEAELLVEVLLLRLENARMQPVYEGAKTWRQARGLKSMFFARQALIELIDVAVTKEEA